MLRSLVGSEMCIRDSPQPPSSLTKSNITTTVPDTRRLMMRDEGVTSNPTSEGDDDDGKMSHINNGNDEDGTTLEEHLLAEYHYFKEASREGCDGPPGDHRGTYLLKTKHAPQTAGTTNSGSA
eukprot:TRINITY_DN8734_c0_g2_i4.p1 TRINITY_DN8734_c0_g2~~TRINITY_DN8734_c0_g2_i4.p1  ORF type:complete len:123 (+),score=20.43 TRINITY_DN8734_c0_g2_i4:159-527(+)